MAADTGNTATVTFGTTGFTGRFMVIGELEQEVPILDDSHLGSTECEEKIPGDLNTPGQSQCEYQFENALPPLKTVETITITYPNGATKAGFGFIFKRSMPECKNNQIMMGKLAFTFNGKPAPVFTPAA